MARLDVLIIIGTALLLVLSLLGTVLAASLAAEALRQLGGW